ncbi:MAG TPA: hypothetical protein VG819_14020 [Rhizomicrobium sp.]|jgi:hypothetical protein|nr:hypothetical protein [Rhizomicrobium sp.]
MKRSGILAIATLCTLGVAGPASADYVRLGSVDVGYRMDKDTQWTRFGGHMEGLRLVADGNDVFCRSIVAQFGNGMKQNVYSGGLREDRPIYVDLQGGSRLVKDITFKCRSDKRSGARIFVAAEVGRFQNEWRSSPMWSTFWSRLFNWGPGGMNSGYDPNYWITLGRQSFEGMRDREATFSGGWSGRSVERIGFRALNGDARCTRARVAFGNGSTRNFDVGRLMQGRVKIIDLPGGNRNVRSVGLVCSPLNRSRVVVEIMARK